MSTEKKWAIRHGPSVDELKEALFGEYVKGGRWVEFKLQELYDPEGALTTMKVGISGAETPGGAIWDLKAYLVVRIFEIINYNAATRSGGIFIEK